jgi:hypothetical protein
LKRQIKIKRKIIITNIRKEESKEKLELKIKGKRKGKERGRTEVNRWKKEKGMSKEGRE